MFAELGIPWKVLYQRNGRTNWVRAVGSSLIGVALLQAVFTWWDASQREARINEVAEQWRQSDAAAAAVKAGEPSPGPIRIISGMRPEAFAKEYDKRIEYRKLWSKMFALVGVLIFCCGGLIDVAASGPMDG